MKRGILGHRRTGSAVGLALFAAIHLIPAEAAAQQQATLTVHSLVMGPGAPSGIQWDGMGRVSQTDAVASIATDAATGVVTGNPAGVVSAYVRGVLAAFAPPDPYGACVVSTTAGSATTNFGPYQDTYQPVLNWTVRIPGYVTGDPITVECEVIDDDSGWTDSDRAGRFVLQPHQIQAVYAAGGNSVFIDVRASTGGGVYFVELSMR